MIVNVTRKIDSVQVTRVLGGAGLTIYEGRVCDSGHRKVSIVRINQSTLSGLILEKI